jgi:hypothetical protein
LRRFVHMGPNSCTTRLKGGCSGLSPEYVGI